MDIFSQSLILATTRMKEPRFFDGTADPDAKTWIIEIESVLAANQVPQELWVSFAYDRLSERVKACVRGVGNCLEKVTERPWRWNWSTLKQALLCMEDQVNRGGISGRDVASKVVKAASIGAVACVAGPALLTAGLGAIGFSAAGPIAGSLAAGIQSTFYGGAVGAGSIFAFAQSLTMGGAGAMALATGISGAGGLAVGTIKEIASKPPSKSWDDGDDFQPSVTVVEALLKPM